MLFVRDSKNFSLVVSDGNRSEIEAIGSGIGACLCCCVSVSLVAYLTDPIQCTALLVLLEFLLSTFNRCK